MQAVGAPRDKDGYEAQLWVPAVVDHWNSEPGPHRKFKVFIFGASGEYKPIFSYGPDDFKTAILLYHDNNHFDGVQKSGNIFGRPYCLYCAKTYDRASRHAKKCKKRCINCSRMGPQYPCPAFPGYHKECQACCKTFANNDCYRHHLQSGFCGKSKKCKECGEIWDVNDNTRDGRAGHQCFER